MVAKMIRFATWKPLMEWVTPTPLKPVDATLIQIYSIKNQSQKILALLLQNASLVTYLLSPEGP
jgi:hypothetical protein